MEHLAASTTHEVNPPLTAMITNADVGLCWLDHQPKDMILSILGGSLMALFESR